MDELGLMRMYTELTGAPESTARCVIIYLEMLQRDYYPNGNHPLQMEAIDAALAAETSPELSPRFEQPLASADSGQLLPAQ